MVIGALVEGRGSRQGAAALLNDLLGRILATAHTVGNVLALRQLSQETTDKGITSSVCVDDLFLGKLLHGVLRHRAVDTDHGRQGTLCDHNHPRPAGVDLGQSCNFQGDLLYVLVAEVVVISKGLSLRLVAEDKVPVWCSLQHGLLEELAQEGCRQVHAEDLVVLCSLFGHVQNGVRGHSQEETSHVVDAGLLDTCPVLRLLHMIDLVVVCGCKVRHKRPVGLVCDQHGAGAGGGCGVNHVVDTNLLGLGLLLHNAAKLIVTHTAHVGGDALGKQPLGHTDGVLGGTTGDVVDLIVALQVLVQGDVLVLSKDLRVGIKSVLLQEISVHRC
eukprot:comp12405_c0_seq1/m.7305 comp12405_c0_seq1/g.7305  ORF comp12405_c0_seq1/g.7305 comp12405_c0_seq1/m.7305 type:complete len:330 (+) comp12405_c0_seq1:559-1548(+)